MSWYNPSDVGFAVRQKLADIGMGARLFVRLVRMVGATFMRPSLVRDQVHFLGNYSLAIIAVSGLFVGLVLGLQGYYTLQRYGSAEALGLLVTLSLVRELGPVVTALLFAGLCALGVWQVERLAWKRDLIARVDARIHAAAVPAPSRTQWPAINEADDSYRRVSVTGRFLPDGATRTQAVTELGGGVWLLQPLRTMQRLFAELDRLPRNQRERYPALISQLLSAQHLLQQAASQAYAQQGLPDSAPEIGPE